MAEHIIQLAFFVGIGISIDLLFGTIARFRDDSLSFMRWSLPLALFHVSLFAAGSYLLSPLVIFGYISVESISGISFVLVSLLVIDILIQTCGWTALPFGPTWVAQKLGIEEENSNRYMALLAYSLDAGFVGLANTATDGSMLFVAIGAGVIVAVIAQSAVFLARIILRQKPRDGKLLAGFNVFGSFASTSAIATFGAISFYRAKDGTADPVQAIITATLMVGIFYLLLRKPIWEKEAIAG